MPKTHGLSKTRTYQIWKGIIKRCYNKNHIQFKDYGGRGIRVCQRWRSFEHFFQDMGHVPLNGTIERKNNDHGYNPKNCRWSCSMKEQARNTRRSHKVLGKTIVEWSEITGIKAKTIYQRINVYGWPPEKAISLIP